MVEFIELMVQEGFLCHHSSSLLPVELGMDLSGVPPLGLIGVPARAHGPRDKE